MREVALMRRMMLFVTVALLTAVMIAAALFLPSPNRPRPREKDGD
jgi:hypothetical protein